MTRIDTKMETRPVSDFDRVSVRGNTCSAQLFITQGEQESLTIEAPPDYLRRLHSGVKDGRLSVRLEGSWLQELGDALATGFNRPPIIIHLGVRELKALEVQCASMVDLARLETPQLALKLNGAGDFRLNGLESGRLEVHHTGTGVLQISGRVEEQVIVLNGVGSYHASGLDSQCTSIRMAGTGFARIRASQTLDVTLRGPGILEYSGHPTIIRRISGLGRIIHIPDIRREAV